MILYHGSKKHCGSFRNPEVQTIQHGFLFGFLLAPWLPRTILSLDPSDLMEFGCLNGYSNAPDDSLKVKRFRRCEGRGWLDFIVSCRLGLSHDYDIVEGPHGQTDTILTVFQTLPMKISREAFWAPGKN